MMDTAIEEMKHKCKGLFKRTVESFTERIW